MEKLFSQKLQQIGFFEPKPHVAVGVSGGADSMALALLLHGWAKSNGGKVTAITIDHGLRKESAAESAMVAKTMASFGINHETIKWQGRKPSSAIQENARTARYNLLTKWCRENSVLHLFTAHHLNDQEETFWQRLAHGSDMPGLAGMAVVSENRHIRIIRPLLDIDSKSLRDWLKKRKVKWIEDPSNENTTYQRVRLRKILADEGLGNDRFSLLVGKFALNRSWFDKELASLMARCLIPAPDGIYISADFSSADELLRRAVLARVLVAVSGQDDPPRTESIVRLAGAIMKQGFKSATLHGCLIARKKQFLLVQREKGAISNKPSRPLTEARIFRSNNEVM